MALFSNFEILIQAAWWIGSISIIVSCGLFLSILALRQKFEVEKKKTADFRDIWESIMIESLDEIPNELPGIKRENEIDFLIIWNYLQELLREDTKSNLLIFAKQVDLQTISRKYLTHSNLKHKLLAINTIGWLKDEESWDFLVDLVNHKTTIVSLTTARTLVTINPLKSITVILPLIATRKDWSIEKCAELIKQIGADEISRDLIVEIYRTPLPQLPKMIRFLDLLLPSESNHVVKTLLKTYKDKEIVYACLNVFKDVEDLKTVRRFLNHKDWEIRMQASICVGKLGSPNDIRRLTRATADTEWWVRYRSAQALSKLPRMNKKRMERIANRNPNCFSHDVILRVVTEKEVAESCGLTY